MSVCLLSVELFRLLFIWRTLNSEVRDESFITSWGGGGAVIFRGGVGNFFGDVLGGLKIKWPMGRGGHVFRQVWGRGVRCVPLVFLFIKSHSFWGAQTPLISQLYNATVSEPLSDMGNKICPFLLNNNLFLQMSPSSFSAFNNNHYHQC